VVVEEAMSVEDSAALSISIDHSLLGLVVVIGGARINSSRTTLLITRW